MGKRFALIAMITFLAVTIVGCGVIQKKMEEGTEGKKVDYTVVKTADYPPEIAEFVEMKRQEKFQVSFLSQGCLYLVRSYGIQSTGGYSIQVEYVTEREDSLHIKTKLVGPAPSETKLDAMSCPIIVVKLEAREKKIIFD